MRKHVRSTYKIVHMQRSMFTVAREQCLDFSLLLSLDWVCARLCWGWSCPGMICDSRFVICARKISRMSLGVQVRAIASFIQVETGQGVDATVKEAKWTWASLRVSCTCSQSVLGYYVFLRGCFCALWCHILTPPSAWEGGLVPNIVCSESVIAFVLLYVRCQFPL